MDMIVPGVLVPGMVEDLKPGVVMTRATGASVPCSSSQPLPL